MCTVELFSLAFGAPYDIGDAGHPHSLAMSLADLPHTRLRSSSRLSLSSYASSASARTSIGVPKVDFRKLLEGKTKSPISINDFRDYMLTEEYGAEVRIYLTFLEACRLIILLCFQGAGLLEIRGVSQGSLAR